MRTTLDIDDDVLRAAQERARRERSSAGRVLSDLARQALTARRGDGPFDQDPLTGLPVLPHRGGVVTSETVSRILDEEA